MHTHRIAGSVHPEDDFISACAQLGEFDASTLDENHAADRLTLQEEEFVPGKGARVGARCNLLTFSRSKSGEERRSTHQNYPLCDVGFNCRWLPQLGALMYSPRTYCRHALPP